MRKIRDGLKISRKELSKRLNLDIKILNSIEHGDFVTSGIEKEKIICMINKIVDCDRRKEFLISLLNRCYRKKPFEKRNYFSVFVKRAVRSRR
jgi:transcriptional regulator with XRE-family HTH domain